MNKAAGDIIFIEGIACLYRQRAKSLHENGNVMLKAEVFISGSIFSINETVFKDLYIELLHMLQVRPLACSNTLLTCDTAFEEATLATINKSVFISLKVTYIYAE